jgi:hypothetical protein
MKGPLILIRSCPRCSGDRVVERNHYGHYITCITCGHVSYLEDQPDNTEEDASEHTDVQTPEARQELPLESLSSLVEELRHRMERHSYTFRHIRMLTQHHIVEPALRTLGWEVADSNQVRVIYRLRSDSASYTLLRQGKPIMIIEARGLGAPLDVLAHQVARDC